MPFPTLGILDAFTRADQDPDTGALWGGGVETAGIGHRILSNQAARTAGSNFGSRTASIYGPNCEAYVSIPTFPVLTGDLVRLVCRTQEVGGFNWDGYEAHIDVNTAGNETLRIREVLNQAPTTLASDTTRNMASGDKLGFECIGTALKLYNVEGGGAWTERVSTTDATYSVANYMGMILVEAVATARLDDFGGGELSPTYEQEGYRFRNDDGNESAATWLAAQDTNITRAALINTRLRTLTDTAGGDPPSRRLKQKYRRAGDDGWRDLKA